MKAFIAGISAFLLTTSAWAHSRNGEAENHTDHGRPAAEASPSTQEANSGERQICRRIDDNTGTRTQGRRVCKTAAEWREFNRRN